MEEITLDRILKTVPSVTRAEAVAVLRELEADGAGTFIVGRKGHASRFKWYVGMTKVGALVRMQKEASDLPSVKLGTEVATWPVPLLEHHFRLRENLAIAVKLPADLTHIEAVRLMEWIKSLPFQ